MSRFTRATLQMSAGALIWAAHFLVIYAFTAIACARGFAGAEWLGLGVVPVTITAATLVAAGVAATMIWTGVRTLHAEAGSNFVGWMTVGCAALALLAILWETLPAFMIPACG